MAQMEITPKGNEKERKLIRLPAIASRMRPKESRLQFFAQGWNSNESDLRPRPGAHQSMAAAAVAQHAELEWRQADLSSIVLAGTCSC